MRKTTIAFLTILLTMMMPFSSFADDTDRQQTTSPVIECGHSRKQPESVETGSGNPVIEDANKMLEDLYTNETDQEIRNMAVDASLTSIFGITRDVGTQLKSDQGNLFTIGRYSQNPDYFKNSTYMVVSKDMGYGLTTNDLIVVTTNSDEGNFEKLQSVYSAAQELKQLTADMCDQDKVKYIHDYICEGMEYDNSLENRSLAEAFCDGLGICNDYVGLFYLFGTYCGLNVENELGYVNEPVQAYHAWNKVEIDGEWKMLDLTWDDTTGTKDYFLLNENAFETSRVLFAGNFNEVKEQVAAACALNR